MVLLPSVLLMLTASADRSVSWVRQQGLTADTAGARYRFGIE